MKELFPGNLVFHKKYGRGIVTSITCGTENINFENYSLSKKVPRHELFTKGDKVYNTSWNGGRPPDTIMYIFYDAITHNPKNKSKFTITDPRSLKLVYAISIKHVDKDNEWYHHPSSSGRFSSTCANFQEMPKDRRHHTQHAFNKDRRKNAWDEFREESKAYIKFHNECRELEQERVDTGKQRMLNDLHLLELESTAKEMLEAIKEIRDDTKEIRNGH